MGWEFAERSRGLRGGKVSNGALASTSLSLSPPLLLVLSVHSSLRVSQVFQVVHGRFPGRWAQRAARAMLENCFSAE